MLALEGIAEGVRKADPKLTKEQAFAKAYTDPANQIAVKAERAASRERLAGFPVARTEPVILNSLDDDEIERLIEEVRSENPYLSNAEMYRAVANSVEERRGRAAVRENVRLATIDGQRVPQPSVAVSKRDNALSAINAKARELRKADPSLSEAQAFAKAYTSPANRELAKLERSASRDALQA